MTPGALAGLLSQPKSRLVDGRTLGQPGALLLPFSDAPPWPDEPGAPSEAIIESFLVDDRNLLPLSESEWLDRWRPRAEAIVSVLRSHLDRVGVALAGPGYLTCSITPTYLLEGTAHVDDDRFVPEEGVGVVAISGQHVGPRVLRGAAPLRSEARPGPLSFVESWLATGALVDTPPSPVDQLVVFAGFGQVHAGPSAADLGAEPPASRQLMVFRARTETR